MQHSTCNGGAKHEDDRTVFLAGYVLFLSQIVCPISRRNYHILLLNDIRFTISQVEGTEVVRFVVIDGLQEVSRGPKIIRGQQTEMCLGLATNT